FQNRHHLRATRPTSRSGTACFAKCVQLGISRPDQVGEVPLAYLATAAYQLSDNRFLCRAATQQLQTFLTELGFVRYQVFELQEFVFVANQNSADQPIPVNNAFLVIALGLIDENNLFIGIIGAIDQADATQVESLYFDDIHKYAPLINTSHIAVMVTCHDRSLLFSRRCDAI